MNLVSILGICVIAAIFAVELKGHRSEYALLISLTAGAVVLIMLIVGVSDKLLEIKNIASKYSSTSFFVVALKSLGICVITGFIADTCREAGQISLASKAEFAGRCSIFILSLPMLSSLLEVAYGYIK